MKTLTLKFLIDSLRMKGLTHDNTIDVHNFVDKEKIESRIDKASA